LACLYQKYFSEKISQLFFVFTGTEEQDDKTTKTKKLIKYFIKQENLLMLRLIKLAKKMKEIMLK